jgi:hypothetical protein
MIPESFNIPRGYVRGTSQDARVPAKREQPVKERDEYVHPPRQPMSLSQARMYRVEQVSAIICCRDRPEVCIDCQVDKTAGNKNSKVRNRGTAA